MVSNLNTNKHTKILCSYNDFMEEKLLVYGGRKLHGSVKVDGAKNAFLPIMAGCVLCDGEIELENFVHLLDIENMREILKTLNIKTHSNDRQLYIDTREIQNAKITHERTQKVRASIFLLGPLLARFKRAVIAYPGGCNIGSRPIDLHLGAFKTLGAKVLERHGYIFCDGTNLKAGNVIFDFPSVGATESVMMCACLLEGETVLKNVAKEPEIVDLQNFLNAMGAHVSGAGEDEIRVVGVKKMHGGNFHVMPDRIVAGTYLLATAICGGDIVVDGAILKDNESLVSFLKQTACQIEVFDDKIRLKADQRLCAIPKIETRPFPFFPTDLQSQMMVLQAVSSGVCLLQENVFENRFAVASELKKMGADIVVTDRTALVRGVEKLYGADVFASDLRAGASLVLAGLKAEGYATVHNVHYIDRGYEKIEERYKLLGADIKRIKIE